MNEKTVYRVTIKPYDASFDCGRDETLLGGSRRCGLTLFNNCRQGECGTCKVRVRKGRVRLAPFMFSALSISEIDADYTLACRSYPLGDLTIAAEIAGWPEARHYPRRGEGDQQEGETESEDSPA